MLQKEDIQQIKNVIQENNKNLVTKDDLVQNNKNLATKEDLKQAFIENNKNLVTKEDLKQAFIENNKHLATKDELHELTLMVQKGFDNVESRFQDLEYQISLRPTMAKIMDWTDRRLLALQMGLQKTKYILRDEWEKLPPQREIHRTLMDRGIVE
ncbi:MAG: hypothetical protein ACKKL6_02215 [Candidatus Komeilibacteria bacterium]